ncbi:PA2169 family four-helix-bundle protein [Sphingobacterium sp. E70]|uniref:PA2169 family four-helix-bundle protein n=1 Tax=Sphingobacterium sp. E70 TaxID=2853439 RepID=UPI00211B758A|nr:PA2169 family four-helix-bundle protein [Sphingobacterium sp. E70]ULT24690.1 PA2169 family four-helix-bundle protein [Sphingobacterium sp. E70]
METITINDSTLINDLIQINNDRIAGYKKAIEIATRLHIEGLNDIFVEYMSQSELFIEELKPYLEQQAQAATEGTMVSGKLFRVWMDIKSVVSGNDEKVYYQVVNKAKMLLKRPIKMLLTIKIGKLHTIYYF